MRTWAGEGRLSRRCWLRLLGSTLAALAANWRPALAAPTSRASVAARRPPTLPDDWQAADAKLYRLMVGRSRNRAPHQAPAAHACRCGETWRYTTASTFTTPLWRCLRCGYVGRADGLGTWR